MLVIKNTEFPPLRIEHQPEIATLQHAAVLIIQNWDQDFALQLVLDRIPIDIEKLLISGRLAIFQNVQPPCVVAAHHAHVVRHDVEDLSHAMAMKFSHKTFVVLGAANFGV